jgi:hypothetical protein
MIRAPCPFCGRKSLFGRAPEEHGGQPTAMMTPCEHFVFQGFNNYVGREYVRKEFKTEPPAGSYSLDADVMKILNQHFRFVGPVAFAISQEARVGARAAVEDFLRARGLLA